MKGQPGCPENTPTRYARNDWLFGGLAQSRSYQESSVRFCPSRPIKYDTSVGQQALSSSETVLTFEDVSNTLDKVLQGHVTRMVKPDDGEPTGTGSLPVAAASKSRACV